MLFRSYHQKVLSKTTLQNKLSNIVNNLQLHYLKSLQENINALRARNKDIEREARQADKVYMDQVTKQGGDAETALLVKKRIEQMEKAKV